MDRWKATTLVLVGVLAGVLLTGPQVIGAEGHETKPFKECVLVGQGKPWSWNPVKEKAPERTLPIPAGWVLVGAGGERSILLCR